MAEKETTLEELLRASAVTNGSISLDRINGSAWRAVICHRAHGEAHPLGHMIHPCGDHKEDPVEALRIALVEDERKCRDLRRRYSAAMASARTAAKKTAASDNADVDDILG